MTTKESKLRDKARRLALVSPKACKVNFEIPQKKLNVQGIIDSVELLTETAIKVEDEIVELPTWLAAEAVLILKRIVRRGRGKPYSYHDQRAKMHAKLVGRRRPHKDADKYRWGRERKAKLKKDGLTVAAATEKAATEMKEQFDMIESISTIAHRLLRPGKYAPG